MPMKYVFGCLNTFLDVCSVLIFLDFLFLFFSVVYV